MKFKIDLFILFLLIVMSDSGILCAQLTLESGDPPVHTNIPCFYKGTISDIEGAIEKLIIGEVKQVATSPRGLPVYAVYYGKKEQFNKQANYNSAVGARDIKYYADKKTDTKPVIYFVGPVHGQEAEGIVGLVNLMHILETGKDYRGTSWTDLKEKAEKCRLIIIPCGNPDGRKRCPYDTFMGLSDEIMSKYGQGTRQDGSLWRWPFVKSLHPMQGEDVGLLGAYFNDNGINIMHDEFFDPMTPETKAILDIARDEAPDIIVSLHSHGTGFPAIHQPAFVPWAIKERVMELAEKIKDQYSVVGLDHLAGGYIHKPKTENEHTSFNLVSALHHVSGAIAFTFESDQGTLNEKNGVLKPLSTYDELLDVQLVLYDQMLDYAIKLRKSAAVTE
jgi:hypothetical protein